MAPKHDSGYGHVGPAGAGHFVKMVHNGIEYGLMEAYAEGFELLRAKEELNLDMTQIANIWRVIGGNLNVGSSYPTSIES